MKLRSELFGLPMAMLGYFAVISQFFIAAQNSVLPHTWQVLPQFLSYFTILTNLLTATFFAGHFFSETSGAYRLVKRPGTATAITGYILVVGLVYQVALRQLWHPTGFAMVVDELLHTIIPALTLAFWFLFEEKSNLNFRMIRRWMIYPLAYVVYTFVRGMITDKYPYPFVDVVALGYPVVVRNALVIVLLFAVLFLVLITVGKRLGKSLE